MNNENAGVQDYLVAEGYGSEMAVAEREEVEVTNEFTVVTTGQKEGVRPMTTEVENVKVSTKTTEELAVDAVAKIKLINEELNKELYERESEVKSLMVGLATGKHVLLLGDPGTGRGYTFAN